MTDNIKHLKRTDSVTLRKVTLWKDGHCLRTSYFLDQEEAYKLVSEASGLYQVSVSNYNMHVSQILDLIEIGLRATGAK